MKIYFTRQILRLVTNKGTFYLYLKHFTEKLILWKIIKTQHLAALFKKFPSRNFQFNELKLIKAFKFEENQLIEFSSEQNLKTSEKECSWILWVFLKKGSKNDGKGEGNADSNISLV